MKKPNVNKTRAQRILNEGWATIGGRIEEYADIYRKAGAKAAKAEILGTYGDENLKDVYNGLLVIMSAGSDAYYCAGNFAEAFNLEF